MFSRTLFNHLCKESTLLLRISLPDHVPVAYLMKLDMPHDYSKVEFPERRRLRLMERNPPPPLVGKPPRMPRDLFDMRGPEKIHNRLLYAEYGIQATGGGKLKWGNIDNIRLYLNRKADERRMFALWRVGPLWKAESKKGLGQRMGGGKAAINRYVFPVRAERIILEMGGKCQFEEVEPFLSHVARILPFKARVVTREIMQKSIEEEEYIKNNNINPFTFEYCAKNNFLGCKQWLSPYDYWWHGKYR